MLRAQSGAAGCVTQGFERQDPVSRCQPHLDFELETAPALGGIGKRLPGAIGRRTVGIIVGGA